MSTRLQVLMDPEELERYRKTARREGLRLSRSGCDCACARRSGTHRYGRRRKSSARLASLLPIALRAREVLFSIPSVSSRDALHIAVMDRRKVSRILSFDRGFDRAPGFIRLPA